MTIIVGIACFIAGACFGAVLLAIVATGGGGP